MKPQVSSDENGAMNVAVVGQQAASRIAQTRAPTLLNYLHSAVAIPLIYLYTIVMGTLSLVLS
ncbi:MAG: hypothetical protein WCD76_19115, partial [Pyrinomonadaceae bacterium]